MKYLIAILAALPLLASAQTLEEQVGNNTNGRVGNTTRIEALEAGQAVQDSRLDVVELENDVQDIIIAQLEDAVYNSPPPVVCVPAMVQGYRLQKSDGTITDFVVYQMGADYYNGDFQFWRLQVQTIIPDTFEWATVWLLSGTWTGTNGTQLVGDTFIGSCP
jgi:hypothetical protein